MCFLLLYASMIKSIKTKSLYVVGDIHGNFGTLINTIKEKGINDSVIILCGDCGIGFEFPEYYKDLFRYYNSVFKERNNICIMLRGNHDDPSYFNGKNKIRFSNVRTIPDYTVLSLDINDHIYNVLCVGGAVSIDRLWRKATYKNALDVRKLYLPESEAIRITHRSYWEDEAPVYKKQKLQNIIKKVSINIVCTHTAPSFCPENTFDSIKSWLASDPSLEEDLRKERKVMDNIYQFLINNSQPLTHWFYGHFHQSAEVQDNNVIFTLLDCETHSEVHIKQVL